MYLVEQPPKGTFTATELERLAVYRAAVAAGFYTDWDGSATATDTDELAWLSGEHYPFTTDEQQRLDRLRIDVEAGRYADDHPSAAPAEPPTDESSTDDTSS